MVSLISTSEDDFTDDQFQVLIKSVDSSAIEVLWLREHNRERLCTCPFSRKNVKIKWYGFSIGSLNYHPFRVNQ